MAKKKLDPAIQQKILNKRQLLYASIVHCRQPDPTQDDCLVVAQYIVEIMKNSDDPDKLNYHDPSGSMPNPLVQVIEKGSFLLVKTIIEACGNTPPALALFDKNKKPQLLCKPALLVWYDAVHPLLILDPSARTPERAERLRQLSRILDHLFAVAKENLVSTVKLSYKESSGQERTFDGDLARVLHNMIENGIWDQLIEHQDVLGLQVLSQMAAVSGCFQDSVASTTFAVVINQRKTDQTLLARVCGSDLNTVDPKFLTAVIAAGYEWKITDASIVANMLQNKPFLVIALLNGAGLAKNKETKIGLIEYVKDKANELLDTLFAQGKDALEEHYHYPALQLLIGMVNDAKPYLETLQALAPSVYTRLIADKMPDPLRKEIEALVRSQRPLPRLPIDAVPDFDLDEQPGVNGEVYEVIAELAGPAAYKDTRLLKVWLEVPANRARVMARIQEDQPEYDHLLSGSAAESVTQPDSSDYDRLEPRTPAPPVDRESKPAEVRARAQTAASRASLKPPTMSSSKGLEESEYSLATPPRNRAASTSQLPPAGTGKPRAPTPPSVAEAASPDASNDKTRTQGDQYENVILAPNGTVKPQTLPKPEPKSPPSVAAAASAGVSSISPDKPPRSFPVGSPTSGPGVFARLATSPPVAPPPPSAVSAVTAAASGEPKPPVAPPLPPAVTAAASEKPRPPVARKPSKETIAGVDLVHLAAAISRPHGSPTAPDTNGSQARLTTSARVNTGAGLSAEAQRRLQAQQQKSESATSPTMSGLSPR